MAEEEIGLRITLRDRKAASQGLRDTKQELDSAGTAAESAGKKAEASSRGWDKLKGAAGAVGRVVTYGVGTVAALGAAAAATGIKTAASMETARIGFTTMLGSGKKARAFLGELAGFAAKTPFEFPDLQSAASSLISVGIDSKKVIPIMTTLGNVTAGMGTGSEGIQRATVALQQMTASQKISGEDLAQLRDAGIPVYDLLASAMGKSKEEVAGLVQEGKLGKPALDAMMGALESGKGLERFNGLMEKQSGSLTGVWSTLKDTVNMGLAKAVKPALPMVKDLTLAASDLAQKAMPYLRSGVKSFVGGLQSLVDAYKSGGIKGILEQLRAAGSGGTGKAGAVLAGLGAAASGVDWGQLGGSIKSVAGALADVDWAKLGGAAVTGASDGISVFATVISFAADHVDTLAAAMPLLIAAFVVYKAAQAASNVLAIASIPLDAARIAGTFTLASSQRALAAQMAIANGVERTTMLMRIRSTAATVASTVASTVAATATKAWAAAQRLLSLAMSLSPIGLLIIGIAALVAGIVWIATKTTWFQTIWRAAWGAIKTAAAAVWNWVKGNWPLLLGILTGPIGIAVLVISKNWDRIKAGAGAVKDFVVDKFTAMVGFFRSVPGRITSAVSGAFDGIKNGFRSAVNWIIDKWNGLSFGIPGFDPPGPGPKFPGISIGTPQLEHFATGGIVSARPGGIIANIGEGRWDEAVVPMDGRNYLVDGTGVRSLDPAPASQRPAPWTAHDIDASLSADEHTQPRPAAPRTLHVAVNIDGHQLGEAVLDNFDDRAARR